MRVTVSGSLFFLLFLVACTKNEEPNDLEGEDQAASVVTAFMKAVEYGDFAKARDYLYSNPDFILKDLQHCQDLFFTRKPTRLSILQVGREQYGYEWHIRVDLKINYQDAQMKKLRLSLFPGNPPKLRGLNPLID